MTGTESILYWSFEPFAMIPLAFAIIAYTRGVVASRPKNIRVLVWWRVASFYAGATAIFIALASPIDGLGERLFVFHMLQHLLLVFVGAPLVLLGAPAWAMTRGLPSGLRHWTVVSLARRRAVRGLARLLTHPMVAWSLFVFGLWAWHLPPPYASAIERDLIHVLEHTFFMGTALLFWGLVIDPVPLQSRLPYVGRLVYVVLALTQGLPLAAFLTFTSVPLYEPYASGAGLWGITPLVDQQLGGLLMWVGGMVPYFIAVAALFVVMMVRDEAAMRKEEEALGLVPRVQPTPTQDRMERRPA